MSVASAAKLFFLKHWDTNGDWHEAFRLFSFGYLVAALAALGINANRRIVAATAEQRLES